MLNLAVPKEKRLTCEDKEGDGSTAKERQRVHVSSRLIYREEEGMSQGAQWLSSLLFFFSFFFYNNLCHQFGGVRCKFVCWLF